MNISAFLNRAPVGLFVRPSCGFVRNAVVLAVAMLLASAVLACGSAEPTPTPMPTAPALPPAWPFVFNGNLTVGGALAPDGYKVTGRIGTYRSASVTTSGGRYLALPVGPLDSKFFHQPIVFELAGPDGRTVDAEQTLVFRPLPQPSVYELDLVFPAFR